jgi:hypothetical protein
MRRKLATTIAALIVISCVHARAAGLPAWNDGPAKAAILDFVAAVTAEGGADFVLASERIATFDNNGTLWVEQPAIEFVDDGPGKPVGIHRFLGSRPTAAFGNSDGDLEMLQWTTSGRRAAASA